MMDRFIVTSDALLKAAADALTKTLTDAGYPFWHWIDNFWLVLMASSSKTAKELWTELVTKVPSVEPKTLLVIRMDAPTSYWGRAPQPGWSWMAANNMGEPG
jgi:hypothetical protein